jgi:hypothetical protein
MNMSVKSLINLLVCVPLLMLPQNRITQAAEALQQFIRLERDAAKQPISLQTAIVRYTDKNGDETGITVDLVGAVHVAEKAYFEDLNRRFRGYDAVLYELVAATDAAVPTRGQRSGHPVSVMQVTIKNFLGLEFQLDSIDYKRSNFVHADLSPAEFAKSMEQRGESFTKLLFRLMGQGMAQQSTDPARANEFAMLGALFSNDRSQDLKRVMAQQFEELEKANAVLDGPDGSTIITDRNRRAIEVLQKQLDAGKRRIAIFYGAAHLPDFDKRLRSQFGLKPVQEQWLEAWNLRRAAESATKASSK